MTLLAVFWPVHDPDVSARELVAVALEDLPGIAAAKGARMAGSPRHWTLRPGGSVPGAGAYETVLTVLVPVTLIRRRQDYLQRVNALARSGRSWNPDIEEVAG